MIDDIKKYKEKLSSLELKDEKEHEQFRLEYLSKKGIIQTLFFKLKEVPNDQKKILGQQINELKILANKIYDESKNNFSSNSTVENFEDLSKPVQLLKLGSRHPISIVKNKIIDIFLKIGFDISEGPEIEDDWHNFTALNLPEYHPARDMQDTFYISKDPDWLLRTHTSSVQIRHMENNKPPIRTISPGRVYRNEDISARSHCFFHQIEGLYIDKNVSFVDLKQTLLHFTKELFGKNKIRLRPSYFPFTEPSAELDIYWGLESETDHRITKGTGWLEILGCGMVDPNVLKNCGIDPEEYSGYAFGLGLERIAMLLYQIDDIRTLYENDVRFLNQFSKSI
ncbi:MAG: phenylalanine--tRNA ligase subunit alpha [Flavobacteriaceae bacterium]|jgi:phenylalanyl-tRNA synthetase alpha chain|nr:phenylalanine--tRNA ligase subunit alpha [Flavobacteriaceae bacterium]|tara:strand:+ start:1834 stop:2850 length:1017 start_codon:yes stop_codon:yes gene_type:complete